MMAAHTSSHAQVCSLLKEGKFRVLIDRVLPLEKAAEAHEYMVGAYMGVPCMGRERIRWVRGHVMSAWCVRR